MSTYNKDDIITSGVVGNLLLWEREHGIMITYPMVIFEGGGGFLNESSVFKGKNRCSNFVVY